MSKNLFKALVFSVLIVSFSCSKNYFQQTHVSPAYSKSQRYKLVLVKPTLISNKPVNQEEVLNRSTFHLKAELSKLNFDLQSDERFAEACRARTFGGSGQVSEEVAREAAKSLGVQCVGYTEISTESIKGGLPIMATIRIINVSDGSLLYSGKARADNPASLEAGIEFAIEKALEGLSLK